MAHTLEQKKLSVEFLYVAVFTTVTVMLWVGFEVFRSLTTAAVIPQVTKEQLEPLSAEIDLEVLDSLRTRQQITQTQLDLLEVAAAPVTESTEGASINSQTQEEATQGGAF